MSKEDNHAARWTITVRQAGQPALYEPLVGIPAGQRAAWLEDVTCASAGVPKGSSGALSDNLLNGIAGPIVRADRRTR